MASIVAVFLASVLAWIATDTLGLPAQQHAAVALLIGFVLGELEAISDRPHATPPTR